jgi:protein-tyrosine-phosphatase
MGCGETYVPDVKIVDWKIADPKNKAIDEARKIRDEIETKIKTFIVENDY